MIWQAFKEQIDPSWTLFLDRDGVINWEKNNDYIKSAEELVLYPNMGQTLAVLNRLFGKTVVATNQKGIGKGLMTDADLHAIHHSLQERIAIEKAHIDAFFYCTDLADDSPNRKPQPGMAYQAQHQFPEIDFSKSIMVGNRLSDMKFGRNAGMFTVFVATTHPEVPFPNDWTDFRFDNLEAFAKALVQG